jgi:hypothetical protein
VITKLGPWVVDPGVPTVIGFTIVAGSAALAVFALYKIGRACS